MFKTILCALELNGKTDSVVEWAIEIAKIHNASIVILFSYRLTPGSHNGSIRDYKEKAESRANARFMEIEKKLIENKIVAYRFLIEVGFLSGRILTHTKQNENSILVIENEVAQIIESYEDTDFVNYLKKLNMPVIILPTETVTHAIQN